MIAMPTPAHGVGTKRIPQTQIWNMRRRRPRAHIGWDEEEADEGPAEEKENTQENGDGNGACEQGGYASHATTTLAHDKSTETRSSHTICLHMHIMHSCET